MITDKQIETIELRIPNLKQFLTDWFIQWQKNNPIGLQSECSDDLWESLTDFLPAIVTEASNISFTRDAVIHGLFCKYWRGIA